MVQLFLNNTEVVPDAGTTIKVTKENPYFTLSDSYTLEVSVPLDIYENKLFFGHIDRTEKAKSYKEYDARLVVNNKTILHGQARITQSTSKEVKLQLTTGVSALKMTAANNNVYIDELDLGEFYSDTYSPKDIDSGVFYSLGRIEGYGIPLRDSTNDIHSNVVSSYHNGLSGFSTHCTYVAVCPKLVNTAKAIASKLGYILDTSCLPDACNSIYIITGVMSHKVAKKLPHWTVSEFFDEFQNFFGCTIEDSGNRCLRLSPLNAYADKATIELSPVDDFEVDYTEEDDAKGVINTNLEFNMNGSDTETVDDEILKQAKQKLYFDNIASARNYATIANESSRWSTLFDVRGELYVLWEDDNNNIDLKRIAPFNPLKRYEDAGTTNLKISPVHIAENEECEAMGYSYFQGGNTTAKFFLHLPEVTNSQGVITRDGYSITGTQEEDSYRLQGLIEGDETLVKNEDKDDVMPVAFLDKQKEEIYVPGSGSTSIPELRGNVCLAFTDSKYKQQLTNKRKKWSLSLNKVEDFDFFLGQLHRLLYQCSRKCKLKASFISEEIPDAKSIFIIRNKRYACEKIEADIKDGELSNLMTGYFYEMKDADAHE